LTDTWWFLSFSCFCCLWIWVCAADSMLLSECFSVLLMRFNTSHPFVDMFVFVLYVCRIPFKIFCSVDLVAIYCFVSIYCGRLLFLHQFWMIILLGRVSKDGKCFHSVLEIHHSMPFLLLKFQLRRLLLFWWAYLCMLFVFSHSFQYSFSVICSSCFNDNMPWTDSILVKPIWCPGGFCTWIDKSFLRFVKFYALILLNILCIPLVCTSSPSSVPMIFKFGLLMESVSSWIFFS
jgi:hypothetical protein